MTEKDGLPKASSPRIVTLTDAHNAVSSSCQSRSSTMTMLGDQAIAGGDSHALALDKALSSIFKTRDQIPSPTRSWFPRTNSANAEFIQVPPVAYSDYTGSSSLTRVQSSVESSLSRSNTYNSHVPSRAQSSHFLLAHGRTSGQASLRDDMANGASYDEHYIAGKSHDTISKMRSNLRSISLGKSFFGGLINPPVVRQFLHDGHLYKEEEDRGISHFELFADLVFVAIVHVGCVSTFHL